VGAKDLRPWARLDLREFELHVAPIHLLDLRPRRGAEHFDDLHELIDARLAREEGLAEQQLRADAAH
jgi:hypothetical protein